MIHHLCGRAAIMPLPASFQVSDEAGRMAEQDVKNVHLAMDRARSMAHTGDVGKYIESDCQLPAHSRRDACEGMIS
jgi:hypothetical protein